MRSNYHGGRNARQWRKQISGLARRTKETVFTYKFPLETDAAEIDFDKAVQTYGIAEGVGHGSLIGLVCAFHLSGFRLFSKAGEAMAFRNRSRYPTDAFAEKLSAIMGIELPTLSPEGLDLIFQSPPRSRDGIAPVWSENEVRNRLYTNWTGRGPANKPDEHLLEIAGEIAKQVFPKFGGWDDLASDPDKALAAADKYFQSQGDFPSIASLPAAIMLSPANSTVDFEGDYIAIDPAAETLLHQAVSRCAARLGRERPDLDQNKGPFVSSLQDALVSSQNNGLSWLFGVGFQHWKEKSPKELIDEYKVPADQHGAVTQVKSFVDAIPLNPLFDTTHYGEFRASVAGKVRSWVANYWKRLLDLKSLLATTEFTLPESISDPKAVSLFSGLLVDPQGLKKVADSLPARLVSAEEAIDRLMGVGIPTAADIAQVERVADEIGAFIGQVQQFNNQVKQKLENLQDADDEEFLKGLKIELPSGDKEPPAINRISGGAPDAAAEISELEEKLQRLLDARSEHFQTISEWAEENAVTLDPIAAMVELERLRLAERGATGDPEEYALRLLLQRIGRLANRVSPVSAGSIRELLKPVFVEEREFNLFFHNRLGSLYRSPYSTSRHQPFSIDVGKAKAIDWIAGLDQISSDIEKALSGAGEALGDQLRDWINLAGFAISQRLRGLPDTVPNALAQVRCPDDVRIPPLLAMLLEEDDIARDVCLKAFNLYVSAINGCLFGALREGFIVRTRFQRIGTDQIHYVPKDKAWEYPDRLNTAKGPINAAVSSDWIEKDGAVIKPVETVRNLSSTGFAGAGVSEYLVQAPHDWYTPLDLRDVAHPVTGLPVEKNITKLKRLTNRTAFRMVGASSFKTHLDSVLLSDKIKLGDFTIIIDQHYRQSVTYGGKVKISYEPERLQVEAAVPVVDTRDRTVPEPDTLFDHIVAIDLGERSVGFAVFDIKSCLRTGEVKPIHDNNGNPVVGTVAVPSIRRLMKAVRSHRRRRQPNQKVNQTYSTALQNYRENVIGDVCNRIDTLMERYNAFPVLEFQIKNFQAGAKQLEIVYGSVLHRYTFSGVDAHKAKRREYWYNGELWEHPYLMAKKWNEETNSMSGAPKRVSLFPGVTVNAARTSQICHKCQRNPMSHLRGLTGTIEISSDGLLELDDGTIRLFETSDYDEDKFKQSRREKRRLDANVLLSGRHRAEYIYTVAKRNLRRPPKNVMTKDTTQSRYTCLYKNCSWTGHADENAAINIGRRYLAERIDMPASKTKAAV